MRVCPSKQTHAGTTAQLFATRRLKMKKTDNANGWQRWEVTETFRHCWWEYKLVLRLGKILSPHLLKVKNVSVILLLGIYPTGSTLMCAKRHLPDIHSSIICDIPTLERYQESTHRRKDTLAGVFSCNWLQHGNVNK